MYIYNNNNNNNFQQYILAKLENLKSEMDEIVKEMKIETNYGIHKYNWSKDYARRLYNHSVGNGYLLNFV